MVVSLLNPPNGASELKRPLHGRFGRERDKNLAAMYSMEIPQRPKICRSGCFRAFPQNFKMPVRQNIIGAAFSFEGRSGTTVFLGNVNFQPRPPKPNFFIFSRTKLIARERPFRVKCIAPQASLEMHCTACNFGGGVASSVRPSGPRPSWPYSPRPHDRLLLQGYRDNRVNPVIFSPFLCYCAYLPPFWPPIETRYRGVEIIKSYGHFTDI
jgi:hypothetical protein